MHAKYLSPQFAARGETGLRDAERQPNFFTHPQFATLKTGHGQHRKYLPLAFTEHGALMAAMVLNSTRATEVSVYVVRAFVELRDTLIAHKELAKRLDELESRLKRKFATHDRAIAGILDAIRQLMTPPESTRKRRIGFV
jgi:phage regulator Rha-like protein